MRDNGDDLWMVSRRPKARSATPYTTGSFDQTYGAFSPNGRCGRLRVE